jgi:hypothetical protein
MASWRHGIGIEAARSRSQAADDLDLDFANLE